MDTGFGTALAPIPQTKKAAARIARFRRAVRLVRGGGQPLAVVALDSGYADQAHMTRDFAAFGAPSPNRLRTLPLSDTDNTIAGHVR